MSYYLLYHQEGNDEKMQTKKCFLRPMAVHKIYLDTYLHKQDIVHFRCGCGWLLWYIYHASLMLQCQYMRENIFTKIIQLSYYTNLIFMSLVICLCRLVYIFAQSLAAAAAAAFSYFPHTIIDPCRILRLLPISMCCSYLPPTPRFFLIFFPQLGLETLYFDHG